MSIAAHPSPFAPDQARKSLLIIGAGDIARRALPNLLAGFDVAATVRDVERMPSLDAMGVMPVQADLDELFTLHTLPPSEFVLHTAPPQLQGTRDERTRNLLQALEGWQQGYPRRVVYISTSGVYGDCEGAQVDESRPVQPATDRARRRCDAEAVLGEWCARRGVSLVILRAPGIYGDDRFPVERVRKGTPVLRREDDVFTNHIHAEDLAGICVRALDERTPGGVYNTVDDSEIMMGDWLDLVADGFGVQRPPRIARSEAKEKIPAPMLSFMSESRRLLNARLKREMGYRLQYPTVADGLRAAVASSRAA
jgi:nucleoside-diphosphate-sugar epimerase